MSREKILSPNELQLSRRSFLWLGGLSLSALALSGDTQSKGPELPIGKYRKVVVVGDSFSNGLGASDQEHGYGPLVAKALGAPECTVLAENGWTTEEVLRGRGDVPGQIEQIPEAADLILATIGGNAINLRALGVSCLSEEGCGIETRAFQEAAKMFGSDKYYADLKAAYQAMLDKAPGADVMIVGYPMPVVPYKLPKKIGRFLSKVGIPELTALGESSDEGLANLISMLNAASREVIRDIGDPRLVYVAPPTHIDVISTRIMRQPDNFHLDMNGNSPDAGHPNDQGYRAMAAAVLESIKTAYNKTSTKNGALFAGKAARR